MKSDKNTTLETTEPEVDKSKYREMLTAMKNLKDVHKLIASAKGRDEIETVEISLLRLAEEHLQMQTHLAELKAAAYESVARDYAKKKARNYKIDAELLAYLDDPINRQREADKLLANNEEYALTVVMERETAAALELGKIKVGYLQREFQAMLPTIQDHNHMKSSTREAMQKDLKIPVIGNDGSFGNDTVSLGALMDAMQAGEEGLQVRAVTGTLDEMLEMLQREKRKQEKARDKRVSETSDVQYT